MTAKIAHPGLVLSHLLHVESKQARHDQTWLAPRGVFDRILPLSPPPHQDRKDDREKRKVRAFQDVVNGATEAQRELQPLYQAAFESREARWKAHATQRPIQFFHRSTPPTQRIAVGLGIESPLGVGLRLHHLYGTPLIPGSALKGLAASYCRQALANDTDQLELNRNVQETIDGKSRRRTGLTYGTLFGDQHGAGYVEFLDAWIHFDSLTNQEEGLLLDVLTPHHQDYYGGKTYTPTELTKSRKLAGQRVPPTDFDSPVPVPFLSVRGTFQFAVIWNGDPADPDADDWLNWTRDVLTAALADWGVGGKTSSGYGRLVPP